MAQLEHINVTVADPNAMADLLQALFGWKIRWQGASMDGQGYTLHVGTEDTYVAIYSGSHGTPKPLEGSSYERSAGLNHIGIVVDDLDATEAQVRALGYEPGSHADYEPGRRFYFTEGNGVEIEVISYS